MVSSRLRVGTIFTRRLGSLLCSFSDTIKSVYDLYRLVEGTGMGIAIDQLLFVVLFPSNNVVLSMFYVSLCCPRPGYALCTFGL